ncbi:winged helix-turn-helix domain-containing protein [Nitrosopumilus sp.]|nr:winged helix-turn-helix domain-containing protein [Nitrosopumilus sp.]MDC0330104.1 winged helix-turn-helix domain-containing protein [Nitrosopumilus sp.]
MENQEKILDHIKKNPGHTQSQITYRLDIPQSTIKYHLLQLTKENKIYSEKLFKTHYFPVGINNKIKIKSCIESNYNLKNIYENLISDMSLDEIATSCDISKSIASKRLQILESMGAIKKIKLEKKIKFCRK